MGEAKLLTSRVVTSNQRTEFSLISGSIYVRCSMMCKSEFSYD